MAVGMIGIIDYDMGNLHSVQKGFEQVGVDAKFVSQPDQLDACEKIVLPGVGAFCDAMQSLREKQLTDPIISAVKQGKPTLGICLGLQLLFDVSYEDGEYQGLGLVSGSVQKFDFEGTDQASLKVPHMGWNALAQKSISPLNQDIEEGAYTYFVHSYYVVPEDASVIATSTQYGIEFVSSIVKDNLMATQFHPEKSQRIGLKMLENFSKL